MMISTTNLRIRCQVLEAISISGEIDSYEVHDLLSNLDIEQVRSAIYRLLDTDRIYKVKKRKSSKSNTTVWVYALNNNLVVEKKDKRKKLGRKNYKEELRGTKKDGFISVIYFRDRKIRLLTRLLLKVENTDTDLVHGIISDYKIESNVIK